jgi:hypothetical protein
MDRNNGPHDALWFFAPLILDPEDGRDTFLRNVGSRTDYMVYIPDDSNIHTSIRVTRPNTCCCLQYEC